MPGFSASSACRLPDAAAACGSRHPRQVAGPFADGECFIRSRRNGEGKLEASFTSQAMDSGIAAVTHTGPYPEFSRPRYLWRYSFPRAVKRGDHAINGRFERKASLDFCVAIRRRISASGIPASRSRSECLQSGSPYRRFRAAVNTHLRFHPVRNGQVEKRCALLYFSPTVSGYTLSINPAARACTMHTDTRCN